MKATARKSQSVSSNIRQPAKQIAKPNHTSKRRKTTNATVHPVSTENPRGHRVKKHRPYPRPGALFEDPQGLEPFDEENRGANAYDEKIKSEFRLMAAANPGPMPTKVNSTAQDTLYTYTQRVYRAQWKQLVNTYREMIDIRVERRHQVAKKRLAEMLDRKKAYQDYRDRLKAMKTYEHTIRMQKKASELAAGYERSAKVRAEQDHQTALRQADYLRILIKEKRSTWITDPDNVNPNIFRAITPVPTGWWPLDRKQAAFAHPFETDDEDEKKYFTTEYPRFTQIVPSGESWDGYYADSQSRPGYSKENKIRNLQNKLIKHSKTDGETDTERYNSDGEIITYRRKRILTPEQQYLKDVADAARTTENFRFTLDDLTDAPTETDYSESTGNDNYKPPQPFLVHPENIKAIRRGKYFFDNQMNEMESSWNFLSTNPALADENSSEEREVLEHMLSKPSSVRELTGMNPVGLMRDGQLIPLSQAAAEIRALDDYASQGDNDDVAKASANGNQPVSINPFNQTPKV